MCSGDGELGLRGGMWVKRKKGTKLYHSVRAVSTRKGTDAISSKSPGTGGRRVSERFVLRG